MWGAMARKWTVATVARTCLEGPGLFAPAALDVTARRSAPSPGPPRLEKAPVAVHPLPQGGEGGKFKLPQGRMGGWGFSPLNRHQATVDHIKASHTVFGLIRCQENRHSCEVAGCSQTAARRHRNQLLPTVLVGQCNRVHRCIDCAGHDGIHADVITRVIGGHGASEDDDPPPCWRYRQ